MYIDYSMTIQDDSRSTIPKLSQNQMIQDLNELKNEISVIPDNFVSLKFMENIDIDSKLSQQIEDTLKEMIEIQQLDSIMKEQLKSLQSDKKSITLFLDTISQDGMEINFDKHLI